MHIHIPIVYSQSSIQDGTANVIAYDTIHNNYFRNFLEVMWTSGDNACNDCVGQMRESLWLE